MSRYLLDTDHVSLHERGHAAVGAHLARHPPQDVAVSAITVEESLRGRLAILSRRLDGAGRIRAYANLLAAVRFFNSVPVVPFDQACEAQLQQLVALRLRRVCRQWRPIRREASVRPSLLSGTRLVKSR